MVLLLKMLIMLLGLMLVMTMKKNSLLLFLVLVFSVMVTLNICILFSSWVSIFFFLVYVGALLMLFFYMFSLFPKPLNLVDSKSSLFKVSLLIIMKSLMVFFFKNTILKKKNDFSSALFKMKDYNFIYFMMFILFMILWLISKLMIFNVSALRPLF